MSKTYSDHRVYVFGDFTLDVDRASLYRADIELNLRPKAFDVLRYLVDRQGKLKWVNGEVTLAFGRNRDRTLKYLAREEPDYIRWLIENDVIPDASRLLRDALAGHFSPAPAPPDKPADQD